MGLSDLLMQVPHTESRGESLVEFSFDGRSHEYVSTAKLNTIGRLFNASAQSGAARLYFGERGDVIQFTTIVSRSTKDRVELGAVRTAVAMEPGQGDLRWSAPNLKLLNSSQFDSLEENDKLIVAATHYGTSEYSHPAKSGRDSNGKTIFTSTGTCFYRPAGCQDISPTISWGIGRDFSPIIDLIKNTDTDEVARMLRWNTGSQEMIESTISNFQRLAAEGTIHKSMLPS